MKKSKSPSGDLAEKNSAQARPVDKQPRRASQSVRRFGAGNLEDRRAQVERWLKENVKVYDTPDSVTLSDFKVNAAEYSGRFAVTLGSENLPYTFSFGLGGNGKPELYWPMFHSPCGVPCSYGAVELSDATVLVMKELLADALPRMRPLGLDKTTGEWITYSGHRGKARIVDLAEYESRMHQIRTANFSVTKSIAEKR